jgi:hypothetical protein
MAAKKVAPTASQTAETKANQQVVEMAASRAHMSADNWVRLMADGWDDRSVGMSENASVEMRADTTDAHLAAWTAVHWVDLWVACWDAIKAARKAVHWAG